MLRLRSDVDCELTKRNPIDEPKTEYERRMRQDALDALCENVFGIHWTRREWRRVGYKADE